jgi:hypothetical protein
MKRYTIYDSTGRILRSLRLPAGNIENNVHAGESYIVSAEAFAPDKYYVMDGAEVEKTEMPDVDVSQSGDVVTVSSVPENTIVIWPDSVKTTESGEFSFESNVTGEMGFIFDAPAHYLKRVVINVS